MRTFDRSVLTPEVDVRELGAEGYKQDAGTQIEWLLEYIYCNQHVSRM
jgi:hypothetical protein